MHRSRRAHAAGLLLAIASCSGGEGPPDVVLTSVDLTPPSTTLEVGTAQQFTAAGHYSDGSMAGVAVNWGATGGTITAAGLYTAGATAGPYVVTATLIGGSTAGTATVTITPAPPTLTSVTVAPATVTLAPGVAQQFTATAHFSDASTGSVPVDWTATGGAIDAVGLYTAGPGDGAYQVSATATGTSITGTASVTITTAPPNLVAIEIAPDSLVRVKPRTPYAYSALGRLSDGSTTPVAVTWEVTSAPPSTNPPYNSIAPDGLFSAGFALGSYLVIATVQSGLLADTVPVNVHETGGLTVSGPTFWLPEPGTVYLCTSNHFTDDTAGPAGTATVTALPAGGVLLPSTAYSNGPPQLYPAGDGYVTVVCQKAWEAPVGLVGQVQVTVDVVSNRPGRGMAKAFVYTKLHCFNPPPPDGDGLERPCGRIDFTTQLNLPDPHWTTLPVTATVTVSATEGANIWFKNTDVP